MKKSPIARAGFTLVELLTVMAIIAILVGLVLGTAGYAQKASARKRAQTEIAAFEAAMESYKADNGIYPQPKTQTVPSGTPNKAAARALYQALSGDGDSELGGATESDGKTDSGKKQYMEFNPDMLGGLDTSRNVTKDVFLQDPFGGIYGFYAPAPAASPAQPIANNPTFDLWSTTGSSNPVKWVTNW